MRSQARPSTVGASSESARRLPCPRSDEDALTAAIIRLVSQYGRYGYRRITAMLRAEGWQVNHKRVERIWRREGLKVPQKHPKRGRLRSFHSALWSRNAEII